MIFSDLTKLAPVFIFAAWTVITPALAQEQGGSKLSRGDLPVEAIEQIVHDYLLQNPEVISKAMEILEQRRRAAWAKQAKRVIDARGQELFNDPRSPVGGNPKGDVTVVEFFDYRCRYCRAVAPTVVNLEREDSQVRIVYKEFPILGPQSLLAAKAALASRAQGKYVALHGALMKAKGNFSEQRIIEIAAAAGLDTVRLRKDMRDSRIMASIEQNRALAQALGINGTPAFVIGNELVPGVMNLKSFKQRIARVRSERMRSE